MTIISKKYTITTIDGSRLSDYRATYVSFDCFGVHPVLIVPRMISDGIISSDLLNKFRAIIDLDKNVLLIDARRFRMTDAYDRWKDVDARTDTEEAQETEDKPEDERGEEPEEEPEDEPEDEQEVLPSPSRQPLRRSKRKRNEARSADEGKRARIAALLVTQWRRESCCSCSEE